LLDASFNFGFLLTKDRTWLSIREIIEKVLDLPSSDIDTSPSNSETL
jgi:hypothetical protein